MTDTPAIAIAEPVEALRRAQQGKSYWKRVWERLRRDKVTLAMAAILIALLTMVIFAPWFTAHDPYQGSVLRRLKPIGFPGHWLGTDEVGRDLWSRMVYGGRLSLLAGVMPVFLALLIGGFLGILAGYAGGLVNSAIMRLADVLYAFPSILLAIAITGILGAGLENTILALTIAFVPPLVRISEAVTAQSVHRADYANEPQQSHGHGADRAGWSAGRITATHSVRGEGRLYIRVFPHKSVTAIPAETRMGKGKGEPEYWAAVVKPGMILFEIGGLPEATARDALARVAYKMPFRCRLVTRRPNV